MTKRKSTQTIFQTRTRSNAFASSVVEEASSEQSESSSEYETMEDRIYVKNTKLMTKILNLGPHDIVIFWFVVFFILFGKLILFNI